VPDLCPRALEELTMGIYKRGRKWYVDVSDGTGGGATEYWPLKHIAQLTQQDLEVKIAKGQFLESSMQTARPLQSTRRTGWRGRK